MTVSQTRFIALVAVRCPSCHAAGNQANRRWLGSTSRQSVRRPV